MAPKLQRSEGQGRIPMFGRISARNPKFIKKKRLEFLCLGKEIKSIMFQRTLLEFQGIQGQEHNSSVCKDNIRIPMFRRIRSKLQCLEE